MSTSPTSSFPILAANDTCVCTAANTTYTGTSLPNGVLLSTAGTGAGGFSEYAHIAAIPVATSVLTNLQLYIFDGTNYALIGMAVMTAQTLSTTTAVWPVPLTHIDGTAVTESNPLRLKSGQSLYAAIGVANAGGIRFNAQRKDY
jgi:hypothetical protein